MLPASIGVFSQSTSVVFGFNSNYDLISSNSQGVLGAKLQNYDGVLSNPLLPFNPFAQNPNQIVTMPVANLIQLPAGQTIQSCTFELQRVLGLPQAHHIVTITAVTPTTNIGPDHVLWANNGNWSTHQAQGEQVLLRVHTTYR